MSELELYKKTLQLIADETAMMSSLKFGTPELEQQMMRAHNTKLHLFARNALQQHEPRKVTDYADGASCHGERP